MKRHSLKRMPLAVPRDDGGAIMFQFETHKGKVFEFECPPGAISEILARMMSALELAAKKRGPQNKAGPVEAIQTHHFETGLLPQEGMVCATLYASPVAPISFALTPAQAQRLSSELAAVAAKTEPATSGSLN